MNNFFFKITTTTIRLIFIFTLSLISFQEVISQNISEKVFGQNAWMPYSIGSTIYNGKLDSQWKKVKDSHAKITRYGGIAVDKIMPTNDQYLNMIDSIRNNGMEPVMLVSFYNNTYTALQAAQTVEFINITSNKNVKYWVIGNEPDNEYGFVNAAQVADYIKKFSAAMKIKDPSIKILAPETAWYNQNIIDGLTTPGGINDITGKDSSGNFIIDIISFHTFPFRGTQRRSDVLNYLSGTDHFEDDLSQLNQKIEACNNFHQRNLNSPLKIAVTEANVNWNNPQGDGIFGLGANSFIGGQFWAEMIGICMKKNVDFINFWSTIEGNELGYLNHSTTLPKPSYYHFQMLADNFKGAYCNGTDNNTNIKSFGSKNEDQISVIIMNQDQSNDFIYKLRLDNNLISGTDPLKINIDAGTNIEYSDTSFRESSVLLIFNLNGILIKKCVYKLYGNAVQGRPPTCTSEAILPQATIISPVNNSFFNLDSTITILAIAFGGTGPIKNLEFFAGITKLGNDTIPPYNFTWNNATAGNYALTARVTDSVNNTFVSEIVNITVINPLTTSISAPVNSSSFNEGSPISIQTASSGGTGTILKVEFFAGLIKLGEDTEAPYNFTWNNATVGTYALTAKATDNGNNTAVSEIINVTVIIPLTATIISPVNNSFFNLDSTITILAAASGGTGPIKNLEFFAGITKLGNDTIPPYNFTWNNATAGNYALTARVTDSVNNTFVSEIVNITVINPLTTSISAPVNSSSFNEGSPISIQTASSGGTGTILKVEFFAGLIKLGEDTEAPYNFTWNNATVGTYALTAKTTDNGNNTAVSEIINVTVIIPLTATIISPVNNSFFNLDSTITILAAASGGTGPIKNLEFFAGITKLGNDTIPPYNFTWNNATAGNYALTARGTDSVNNTFVSEIVNITVINPLTTSISAPVNSSSFNEGSPISIQTASSGGTGTILKVEFFAGLIKLGEDTEAPYNFTWNNATVGTYALTAKATDNGNNTAVSEIINVTVIIPLTATIISPVNNSFFNLDSTITILAAASGGTGPIKNLEFFAGITKLGNDTIPPYNFTWNNATAGNYALTARVTDSVNNTFVSEIVNITVINPLTTSISAPVNSSSFNEGSPISIQTASSGGTGTILKVEFFAGLIKLGEDTEAPYNFTWNNATVGTYALTAKATDNGNNTAVSEIINVTVIIPLTATIISPLNNSSFTTDSIITIQATASGGRGGIQKVEFFAGTTKLSEDITSPYSFSWINAAIGNYALTVKATDSINNIAVSGIINITINPAPINCTAIGTIAREVWSNIGGTSVSAIPIGIAPSLTGQLTIFQAPENFANNYGQRIRGYVCPPASGNYIFWIASDNNSELWLSTNDNPVNRQKIASVSGFTSPRQWTKYSTQKSVSKNLIAGQLYYIEALHKDGNQGDNCAVGWQLPSGALERPIPGNRLLPFAIVPPAPAIELVSAGGSWKYLDNGTNQGGAWTASSFSDAIWKTGNAELGYGDGGEATVVSYGPSSTNKYITTYFRKTFNIIDKSTISGLELSLIRDDGAVVYINGVEVYRNNLPSGTIYYNTLAPSFIDGVNESTFVVANISSSALVNGTNLIAVEIHQNAVASSDISFNLKLKTLSGSKISYNIVTSDSLHQNTILVNNYEMIVYPNPNTGQFNLEFCIDDIKEKNVIIEVTNSIGIVVYKKLPVKINGCIKETIDLEPTLPTGVYIMKVSFDDKIQTAKMLLTR